MALQASRRFNVGLSNASAECGGCADNKSTSVWGRSGTRTSGQDTCFLDIPQLMCKVRRDNCGRGVVVEKN
jgi:hypothetical protein